MPKFLVVFISTLAFCLLPASAQLVNAQLVNAQSERAQKCTSAQQSQYEVLLKNWLKLNIDPTEFDIEVIQLTSACPGHKKGAKPVAVSVAPKQAALWFETMRIMFVNNGQSFALIYKLQLRQKTLVTRCDIAAGEALPLTCIEASWQQVKKLTLTKVQPEDFALKLARRQLNAGSVLEMNDWQRAMAIQAGQKVKIHYQQGAIKVEAPGTAMKAANIGDNVVVLLDGQQKSILARLGNNGEVYID